MSAVAEVSVSFSVAPPDTPIFYSPDVYVDMKSRVCVSFAVDVTPRGGWAFSDQLASVGQED